MIEKTWNPTEKQKRGHVSCSDQQAYYYDYYP